MLANQVCLALPHISLTLVVSALGLGGVRLSLLGEKFSSVSSYSPGKKLPIGMEVSAF